MTTLSAWLLTYAAHSVMLTVFAAAIERTRWGSAPRRRDALWKLALTGGFATSTAFVLVGSSPSGVAMAVPPEVGMARDAAAAGLPWPLLVWTAVTVFLIVRTARAWRHGVRLAGRRRILRRGPARAMLDTALGPSGAAVALTCSRTLPVPLAFGREICVPVRALRELSRDELRALLAHEAAHIVRRDARWLIAAALVRIVGWWQPLNFVAAARLRLAMELCCDERAAADRGARDALARCLVTVAGWSLDGPGSAPLAAMASRGSALRWRLESLFDSTPRATGRVRPWLSVAALVFPAVWLAPVITVATVSRVPEVAGRFAPRSPSSSARAAAPDMASSSPWRATASSTPSRAAASDPRLPRLRTDPVGPAAVPAPDPVPPASAALAPAARDTAPDSLDSSPAVIRSATAGSPLRDAVAVARVPPVAPRPTHNFDMPARERRALGWIAYLRTTPSFDPNRPTYDIR